MTADNRTPTPKRGAPVFFYYTVAVGMLLLGTYGALRGMPWVLSVLLVTGGATCLLGLSRPVFRAAVRRVNAQQIVCRLVPWYQSNTLATALGFPVMGIVAITLGRAASFPLWLYGGYFIVFLGAGSALLAAVGGLTNRLWFTPSTLVVRILGRRYTIPRERVVAIKPRILTLGIPGRNPIHTDLIYDPGDGRSNRSIAMLDAQFSVDPANFASALQVWKDADPNDPDLMDRVEAILRGRGPDGV